MTNKDLLYSTGNSAPVFFFFLTRKETDEKYWGLALGHLILYRIQNQVCLAALAPSIKIS